MTDRKALLDQNETPEDVATLYSWANLHGAKYRDFSASRAQTREKSRLRVIQAIEEEKERARLEAEGHQAEQLRLVEETARAEEQARQDRIAAEHGARQEAARQAAQVAAQQAAERAAQEAQQAAEQARAAQFAAQQAQMVQQAQAAQRAALEAQAAQRAAQDAQAAQQASQQIRAAQQAAWQQLRPEIYAAPAAPQPPYYAAQPAAPDFGSYVPPQPYRPAAVSQPGYAPAREEWPASQRNSWGGYDARETAGRPAWLSAERPEPVPPPALPTAPEDTLQGSRDRLTSRWFALKGVFQGAQIPVEPAPVQVPSRSPVLAVFSLAGGVGKTSLTATLGRALSSRGERVLLVDTAAYGLLPFYFGARDQRPGQLRTFTPPGTSGDAPIQMITLDPESMGPDTAQQEPLAAEIGKYGSSVSRVIVDLATASGATTRRVLRMSPLVLVPVTPDMNSVVSVGAIDSFFQHAVGVTGPHSMPYYVLNQFDASLPLHLDVREVLREQLGERLLPFALRRAPAVSEALAEGMTVMDYAPNSTVAEDFGNLAGWVKSQSAPASSGFRGVRWSER
jgi:cellulose synthase operon protein YhjQ